MDTLPATEPVATPAPISPAREASLNLLEKSLPAEQAAVLRKSRAAAKASAKAATPPPVVTEPVAETKAEPAKDSIKAETAKTESEPASEVIDFGSDEPVKAEGDEVPETIAEDDIAKFDEAARKKITDLDKDRMKLRKRAQEAEEKAKAEIEAKQSEWEAERSALNQRMAALAGNEFAPLDANSVKFLGTEAQKGLALLEAHETAVEKGRAEKGDAVLYDVHEWSPSEGKWITRELNLAERADRDFLIKRTANASAWFENDAKISRNEDEAKKQVERYAGTKGYAEALAKYQKADDLHTRLPELMRKAALFDVLQSRKAKITFTDEAGAATKAPSTTAERSPSTPAKKPAPPVESAASTPRMAATMDGDDIAGRKSQLMEKARTAKTDDERQRYIKQMIMLGNPKRTNRQLTA